MRSTSCWWRAGRSIAALRNLAPAFAFCLGLASCTSPAPEPSDAETPGAPSSVASVEQSPTKAAVELSQKDEGLVCRAAIADLNGHKPAIVKVVSSRPDLVRVRYKRPDDGKLWTNECRFDGDRVIWRTVDAFGSGSGMGRWRESPMDETIRYSMNGSKVTISTSYSDGSGGSETYSFD